ncbi:extracellular ligand-binding receptor [Oceaniovalibus guishaninsula JLT2003]|uniref:Extracellular ligand-binding receptor n=1 Tax=Oceaniovalibus guishaninsula JLT2003 TaxID=1231392 RepID=K2GMA1_9RHOB|nr:penicillin-binding protein activator [Oceaniovalibus guishaninsula]EKE43861.1 extracellular ligand-binding receptor [Oceaniovalibus guishaninsula JLT2003]
MFASIRSVRNPLARLATLAATLVALAACQPMTTGAGRGGPSVDPSAPVPVALLVPKGEGGGGGVVGQSLENAARLAVNDLRNVRIDLRVYDTAGNPATAAAAAQQAIADGAGIIVGPLYSQTTAAVTSATAGRNVNVLSFSNNAALAGGNVFVLGQTFSDIAGRLSAYAVRQGRNSVVVVHSDDLAGQVGRDAIVNAARANNIRVAGVESYPLSQQGIVAAGPRIAQTVQSSGATSVFLTANVDSDLPLIATTLPENGVDPGQVRMLGLTRWNSLPQALTLPGLQGGLFTLPDQSVLDQFEARYRAAYGSAPHPLAGLAYDAIQAIGSLVASGRSDALTGRALTQPDGFAGSSGVFRLRPDGTTQRALAIAQIQNNQVVIVDPAPRRFGAAGF